MTTEPFISDCAVNAGIVRQAARILHSALVGLGDASGAWRARARSRFHLTQLSDHQLQDIGLSRSDVIQEFSKPFWRE